MNIKMAEAQLEEQQPFKPSAYIGRLLVLANSAPNALAHRRVCALLRYEFEVEFNAWLSRAVTSTELLKQTYRDNRSLFSTRLAMRILSMLTEN